VQSAALGHWISCTKAAASPTAPIPADTARTGDGLERESRDVGSASDAGELYHVDQPGFDDVHVAVVRMDGAEVVNVFVRLPNVEAIIAANFVALFEDWRAHDLMATPRLTFLS
jgi:hypothetical protein